MIKRNKKIEKATLMNLIQYGLTIVIGVLLMVYPQIGILEPVYYISIVFYTLSFITCLFYFLGRRKNDYESILMALINVVIASYLFMVQDKSSTEVLGIAVSAYTILIIFNKMYRAYILKKNEDILWGVKYITSLLLAFLGLLTMFNLFNEISVVILMFGYYFILFGIINLMEPLVELLFEFNGIKNFLKYIEGAEIQKNKTKKKAIKKLEKDISTKVKEKTTGKNKNNSKKTLVKNKK